MSSRHPTDDAETLPIAKARTSELPSAPAALGSQPSSGTPRGTLSETAIAVLQGESAARAETFGRAAAVLSAIGLVVQARHYREGVPALQGAMAACYFVLLVSGVSWRDARAIRSASRPPRFAGSRSSGS